MPLAIGTRLGSYEVTAQIGAGGMGEVYSHKTIFEKSVVLRF